MLIGRPLNFRVVHSILVDEGTSTVTVVVTDLVGSTRLRARLGEERADELRVQDRLLTARVEAHGGRCLRYTGGGLLATFMAASSGPAAAVEMQQAIASYNRRLDAVATRPPRRSVDHPSRPAAVAIPPAPARCTDTAWRQFLRAPASTMRP
jgi:class 3 adenylate cyclase